MANEEERVLEKQLEVQLKDQRESLTAIDEALASDPSNPELLSVHEELVQAINDAEEGLLHLKRARLLQEADLVLHDSGHVAEEVKAEPIDPADDMEPEPLQEQSFSIGSKCRFRHTDGRWYNGRVIGLEGPAYATISFLTPTSESMLMCKFFMQQRCRFGNSCRLSHGMSVPLSSLRHYVQVEWNQSMVGSKIWAISGSRYGIWREAELQSWNNEVEIGHVVFTDDGSSAKLEASAMSFSEYAEVTDDEDGEEEEEEESDSGSEESASSDYDEETLQGLGFLQSSSQLRGVQTETAIFAEWENHTRGVASKMMASMGYHEGMGLGASGQGMLDPISVKVLKPKQSLDHALEHCKAEEGKEEKQKKKRSRGGKRKREKKFAAVARAVRQEEESQPDVFRLINKQLTMHHEAINKGSGKKKLKEGPVDSRKVDRRSLVAYEDEIKDLKLQAEKLEEMVKRNKKEKVVYEAAMRRLDDTRKALAEKEAAHASTANAVASREKEKKWLKF